jgi:MarR family transcriptional regulator, 2-MHQ and catechol-resistance regulon repressor
MEQLKESEVIDPDENYGLWRLLDHTHFMISRLREKELHEFGLTPEQAYILDILAHSNGTSTINNIIEITQRKHHSVSTQIERMARQGLIDRKKHSADLRQYDISITARGQALLDRVTRDSFEKTFSCLQPDSKKELRKHLEYLLERAYGLHGIEHKSRFVEE